MSAEPDVVLTRIKALTRRAEPFTPLTSGKASIHCCGFKVYDLRHLSHASSCINWVLLRCQMIW